MSRQLSLSVIQSCLAAVCIFAVYSLNEVSNVKPLLIGRRTHQYEYAKTGFLLWMISAAISCVCRAVNDINEAMDNSRWVADQLATVLATSCLSTEFFLLAGFHNISKIHMSFAILIILVWPFIKPNIMEKLSIANGILSLSSVIVISILTNCSSGLLAGLLISGSVLLQFVLTTSYANFFGIKEMQALVLGCGCYLASVALKTFPAVLAV